MLAKTVSAAALLFAVTAGAAAAQARGPIFPAEMPPASYTGAQYVDSNGCVFVRAGFNGRVNWVPRLGNDRRPMCGMQPSLAGAAPAPSVAAPAPRVAAAPAAPAAPRVQPRAAPAPVVVGGVPYSVPPEQMRPRAGGHGAQVVQVQGLDTRWSFYDRTGPSPCTGFSPHSQLYLVPSPARPDLPLRCGPQAQHPADAVRELAPRGNQWEPWDGVNPSPMAPNVYQLPPTYAPRWPHTQLDAPAQPRQAAPAPLQVAAAAAPRAHISTMGAAPAPVAAGGRYVQVGTFGVEANARSTAARLQASGLPVAMGRTQRGGQALQIVMAGPFASDADLRAALSAARSMGFGDAFMR
jgi:hypothetical protein